LAIYTPVFNEIRELLYPIIINLLKEYGTLKPLEIGKHIRKMKQKDKEKFSLISFDFAVKNFSREVNKTLVDMVRHCLIEETSKGYALTELGKHCIGKSFEQMCKL